MRILRRARAGSWIVVILAGCASQPPPLAELSRARTLIEKADSAGVQLYAAADLEQARGKLRDAEKALAEEENEVARMRANEAAADAELADIRANGRAAQRAVQEMSNNLEALRQEAARGIPHSESNR
jgi:septal ring factor EnvC (AmiA/AmiB activator)